MKKNIFLVAALAFSVNAIAQNTCGLKTAENAPVCSGDKMASMNQNVGNFRVSVIDPGWAAKPVTVHYSKAIAIDCYRMEGNYLYAIKGGQRTSMLNYTTVGNGDLVLVNGVVIAKDGEMLFLKNGDSIDVEGEVTRKGEATAR